MIQLYRSIWLTDSQRANVSCALNAMQEKSSFMGVSDMPIIKNIETANAITNELSGISQLPRSQQLSSARMSVQIDYPISNEINPSISLSKPVVYDSKHDTRIVNESFQVRL